MKTTKDLGRQVKKKYPGQYNDLSDEEVGRLVKRKYPDAYDDYQDTSLSVTGSSAIQTNYPDQQLERKVQDIWNRHEPGMGNVVAWWRRRKLEGQNKFLESANDQQRLLIEQASIVSEAYAKRQMAEAEFRVFLAQHAAQLHLLGSAARAGMTIPDYSTHNRESLRDRRQHEHNIEGIRVQAETEIQKAQRLAELELEKERQRHQLELERERRKHEIEAEKDRQKRRLELEVRDTEYRQDQENVDRLELVPIILGEKKRQHLNKLYDEREALSISSDPAKAHKLRVLDATIQRLEDELIG
jgi:hypothetical protein